MSVLNLTPEQLSDLDAIIVGSLARTVQEWHKAVGDEPRETFYADWKARTERLQAIVRAGLPPLEEDEEGE